MKLRTKFAIILLLMAVVLSIGVYGGLELYKDRLVGEARQEVNETARLTADQIDTTIEERKDFIGYVASRPRAAQFSQSEDYLLELVDNSRFFAAQLVASNGTIIDFHGDITQDVRRESVGRDVANRTYVQESLAGAVHMTEPEYVNATDKYLVVISAPIFDDREIKGVLAAAIYVDQQTFFSTISPLETSQQSVTVETREATLHEHHNGFEQRIQSTATVGTTGWQVTVVRDRSDLIAQLRDLAIVQGLGLLIVLLSVIGYGMWEYRTTLNQTEELLKGFGRLEVGEFEYTLDLTAGDEWVQISDGFNDLAAELHEREEELQQREQRLEVLNRVLRHNLRNQTSVILGYAEFIREAATDPELVESANSVMRTALQLAELSDKARDIETIMDMEVSDQTSIEVVGIVDAVVDRLLLEYPDVTITKSTPQAAWVRAIPRLESAIASVCENACEHNDNPEPTLKVTVNERQRGDHEVVQISIADNGPGIPVQERSVITEGRETPLEHGSGLGLWLAHWALEKSDGELRFDPDDSGGTVVILELQQATQPPENNAFESEDSSEIGD